jgi:hypothetical protein
MRAKERIPIVLEFFKNNIHAYLRFIDSDDSEEYYEFIRNYDKINNIWLDNPDWRLGQLLINIGLINDGFVWNIEEQEWLVKESYFKFEDIHFWGVNYDKEGNLLDEPYKKLLSELDDEHIKNIIKYFEDRNVKMDSEYLKYFKSRVEKSNGNF